MKYFNFLIYLTFFSLAIAAFWIFIPFKYIDNYESRAICDNGVVYQTGPSIIFSYDGRIDAWNGKKLEKLCAYGMILDYYDVYKASGKVNYRFSPAYLTDSSWLQAVFLFGILGGLGILGVKAVGRSTNIFFTGIVFLAAGLIFVLFLKKPATQLFCLKKSEIITSDFRVAANRSGKTMPKEEENYIKTIKEKVVKDCMR